MPEALARMRREPTLSAPAPVSSQRRAKAESPAAAALARPRRGFGFLPKTLGGYLAILFGAALIGVVANAVLLQRERHPAPLFGAEPAPVAAKAPAAQPVADSTPAPSPAASVVAQPSRPEVAPMPVARPLDHPAAGAALAKKSDQINDLLRNGGGSDSSRDLVAAQRALIKLGYDIEADGVMGAGTERALRDFEKSHGLPLSSEITPRLLSRLNTAAR